MYSIQVIIYAIPLKKLKESNIHIIGSTYYFLNILLSL